MLRELAEVAKRFQQEGTLLPIAYKPKTLHWIVDIADSGEPQLLGPFKKGDLKQINAPDRQRSGKIGPDNLKPYLLMDDARYALGICEPGKEEEAALAHKGFVSLLEEAHKLTNDPEIGCVLRFLDRPLPEQLRQKVGTKDIVTFRCNGSAFLFEKPAIQRYWANRLGEELVAESEGICCMCAQRSPLLRILPKEIVVMGQKCQITSFNLSAFWSFGKSQTANAPLCYSCAMDAIQALDHLIRDPKHRALLARDDTRGQSTNPLRNQLAVFWLKVPEHLEHDEVEYDIEAALGALMKEEERRKEDTIPLPELAQLEALLRLPWTARESSTRLSENDFYLAVLSANKGRLVVREWMSISLAELRAHLASFLDAVRIVSPYGDRVRAFTIPTLILGLRTPSPNLTRGLLRAAYLGYPPPQGLLETAVHRFRIPKTLDDPQALHAVAAVLKLVITHGEEEAGQMEQLDTERHIPAYLCGRLLAILEEAQQRASRWRLNTTLVDRFYGAASTAPASTFGTLIRQAEIAHLPKIRKERWGHGYIQKFLEEVMSQLDEVDGFPKSLTMTQQAEFALGFYHQRAAFRADRSGKNGAAEHSQE